MVASIGGIGALVSGGSALAGLLGVGKSTPAAPPPVYQPQNSQGADTSAYSGTQNLSQYNTAGTALPYANQTFQSLYNNPYASTYQSGANAIAPAATAGGRPTTWTQTPSCQRPTWSSSGFGAAA